MALLHALRIADRCSRLARGVFTLVLAVGISFARAGAIPPSEIPVSGIPVPELAFLDSIMLDVMSRNNIEAGLLGVAKDGVIVYQRGFGWRDREHLYPLQPDALMRLGSVAKTVTAAAIRTLIADGRLRLEDHAFDLGQPGGGILHLQPFPQLGDPRLANVTIQHLLEHRGGWDRDLWRDPWNDHIQAAQAMGVPSPPSREDMMRYFLGLPIQHDPGATFVYSNVGYHALGLIVEAVSGRPFLDYVHDRVFASLGVGTCDLEIGRTFPADRNPREPWYSDPWSARNVFDPTGPVVPFPDGGFHHEGQIGMAGLIASTAQLLRLIDAYNPDQFGTHSGAIRDHEHDLDTMYFDAFCPDGCRRQGGQIYGTRALAMQVAGRMDLVVLFNKSYPYPTLSFTGQVANAIRDHLAANTVDWPTSENVTDVNGNGLPDGCDITRGICRDFDGDMRPDECDAPQSDVDGDGIVDADDNCSEAANPNQLDVNLDGFGNACDADYDDDGVVGLADWGRLGRAFGAHAGESRFEWSVDADGDGGIGMREFGVFGASFGEAPGPSGLACAGSSPCEMP